MPKRHQIEQKPPLAVEQLARLIQFHPESVRRAIRRGAIRAIKCGPFWRIPNDEADRILQEGLPCN